MRWQGVVVVEEEEDGEATKGVEGEERGGGGQREREREGGPLSVFVRLMSTAKSLDLHLPPRRPIGSHLIPTNVSLQDTRANGHPYRFYNSIYVNTHLSND